MRADTLKFKTIVVATDLSEAGSSALHYAQSIARAHESTLIVVHVVDPVSYAFPNGVPDTLTADPAVPDEVKRIEEDARRQGISVHSVIESGNICERILQVLEDHRADLLVLGTRAKTEAGRIALGTIARRLLAKAPCAVLTVSPNAHARRAGEWRRVLAATDFSAASLAGVRLAQSIVNEELIVLHAAPGANEQQRTNCLEQLRSLAPFNESHTVPVDHIVASGEAGEVIAGHARSLVADLVVVGSPLNELAPEDFPTSTILQVISQVSCPVLSVPPGKDQRHEELVKEAAFSC